jgi:hypothetical protein
MGPAVTTGGAVPCFVLLVLARECMPDAEVDVIAWDVPKGRYDGCPFSHAHAISTMEP